VGSNIKKSIINSYIDLLHGFKENSQIVVQWEVGEKAEKTVAQGHRPQATVFHQMDQLGLLPLAIKGQQFDCFLRSNAILIVILPTLLHI
jgi:hypothetical protein